MTEEPARSFDDQWGGTGGPWLAKSDDCFDPNVFSQISGDGDFNVSGAGLGSTNILAGGCQYLRTDANYAFGYYYLADEIAESEPVAPSYRSTPSLGDKAATRDQALLDPKGCFVLVPRADSGEFYLGVTVNSSELSAEEACADAIAFLRIIANQKNYVEPVQALDVAILEICPDMEAYDDLSESTRKFDDEAVRIFREYVANADCESIAIDYPAYIIGLD